MKIKFHLILCIVVTLINIGANRRVFATDPQFSQFYANPLYLNPAFAGSQFCTRMVLIYRNQPYPEFGAFTTYGLSVDSYFEDLSGGLGINLLHDNQGGLLSHTIAGLTYAYHGQLTQEWHINFGLQINYINRRLHWNELIFPDQGFGQVLETGEEVPPQRNSSHTVGFASGVLLYNSSMFFGASIYNLTQPRFEFLDNENKLQRKYTFHFGYEFLLRGGRTSRRPTDDIKLSPNLIAQSQSGFTYFNYGFYATILPVKAGVWFRHDLHQANSMIFMLGLEINNFTIGYSYEASLSGFSGFGRGAQEISVLRNFNCTERNKKYRILNCPTF